MKISVALRALVETKAEETYKAARNKRLGGWLDLGRRLGWSRMCHLAKQPHKSARPTEQRGPRGRMEMGVGMGDVTVTGRLTRRLSGCC
jgi:hypothetical protein